MLVKLDENFYIDFVTAMVAGEIFKKKLAKDVLVAQSPVEPNAVFVKGMDKSANMGKLVTRHNLDSFSSMYDLNSVRVYTVGDDTDYDSLFLYRNELIELLESTLKSVQNLIQYVIKDKSTNLYKHAMRLVKRGHTNVFDHLTSTLEGATLHAISLYGNALLLNDIPHIKL